MYITQLNKVVMVVLLLLVLNAGLPDYSEAQTPVDSEQVARSLLSFGQTANYEGEFYGCKTNSLWTRGFFRMNKEKKIIWLQIDRVEISITTNAPLQGIFFERYGPLSHFSLNLSAIDGSGRHISRGSYSTELLDSSSIIQLSLAPNSIEQFLPFTAPQNIDPNWLRLQTDDGRIFWYSTDRGGFVLEINPFGLDQSFTIIDSQGEIVLAEGSIGAFKEPTVLLYKPIHCKNDGNVREVQFPKNILPGRDGDMQWYEEQVLNSRIKRNGHYIPAKVFTADLSYHAGLIVWISDPTAQVVVKSWMAMGEMSQMTLMPLELDANHASFYTDNPYVGKVIIVITGSDPTVRFKVGFVRYDDDPT